MMKIRINEATINTASVEIKTLTISGKQITLAVFRQLPEKSFYENSFNLCGKLWGRVNYCPGSNLCRWYFIRDFLGSRQLASHIHVVWEQSGILYRSGFYTSFYDYVRTGTYTNIKKDFESLLEYVESLPQLFIAI